MGVCFKTYLSYFSSLLSYLLYLISSFSFAITHLLFLLRCCKEWSLLRFTLLSAPLVAPLVAPLRSSAIDIRAVVRRISSLEDEVESLLKDREIKRWRRLKKFDGGGLENGG
ncbi:hypothetical protein F2Q69_00043727 [Brassica cretica]|uniref:Uncharacterized protein n=1 Tax=Brassica cretica TaxID=69181 RepID=A0A8S9NHW2_BRACR|nr:hypothetical protein F2Q69_00043727 [Brassica cretica]